MFYIIVGSVGPYNIAGFDKVEALASYLVCLIPADNTAISLRRRYQQRYLAINVQKLLGSSRNQRKGIGPWSKEH